jgi:hypothetical protein
MPDTSMACFAVHFTTLYMFLHTHISRMYVLPMFIYIDMYMYMRIIDIMHAGHT